MLPYKHSRSFPQYARLYNAAASPASRLRSGGLVGNQPRVFAWLGSLAIINIIKNNIINNNKK